LEIIRQPDKDNDGFECVNFRKIMVFQLITNFKKEKGGESLSPPFPSIG
jgi:hypothetical protein